MEINGLDYNTQRDKLVLPEYGREIQNMVRLCIGIPDRNERLRCAKTIVAIMGRMLPQNKEKGDRQQRLWEHLAILSDFKLDIDWPVDISNAHKIEQKPDPVPCKTQGVPVRHYGRILCELFELLKTMDPGPARDRLVSYAANQMKRNLVQWSHGSSDDEKVASDLAKYTDGKIQLDLSTFRFEKIQQREFAPTKRRKR